METMHESVRNGGFAGTRCGKGLKRTTKKEKVTCGRCKLLAKFAAKRAKNKGK
jgi:hypothetical protein